MNKKHAIMSPENPALNIESLRSRCVDAKMRLEAYITEQAEDKELSIEWFKTHHEIIAIYLNVALSWLERGQVSYGRRLARPCVHPRSKIDPPIFYEKGTPIVENLAAIELMLLGYGLPPNQPPPAIRSAGNPKKRARSQDSAIALESPHRRSRIEAFEVEEESSLLAIAKRNDSYQGPLEDNDEEDDLPIIMTRRRRAETTIEGEESIPHGGELERQASDDEDDDYEGDTDESSSDGLKPRVTSLVPISLQALVADEDTPLSCQKRRGRPSKSALKGAFSSTHSVIKKIKENKTLRAMREPSPHEDPVSPPLQYNYGRSRPANMPQLPCPEGINPRVWYGMSYICQKQRMKGLQLLADMPTESSDWPTTTDEEDNQVGDTRGSRVYPIVSGK